MEKYPDIEKVLISEDRLSEIVSEIAEKINRDFKDQGVILLVILKGSMIFASDLMRKLDIPVKLDFIRVSSYGKGTKSCGEIKIKQDTEYDISGENVVIVEDITDSGNTLFTLKKLLAKRNPKKLLICTLLDKPERHEREFSADYIGETVPDEFVVGYGLDYDEKYRELPFVGVLRKNIYEEED